MCKGGESTLKLDIYRPKDLNGHKLPAVVFVHGDGDTLVPLLPSERMEKKMKATGCTVELPVVKNAAHGFRGRNIEPDAKTINQKCFQWLDKHLKK